MQGTKARVLTHVLCFLCISRQAFATDYKTLTSTVTVATKTTTITLISSLPYASSTQAGPTNLSPTASGTPTMTSGSLQDVVLNSTNWYRTQHQVQPVVWNDTLADYAKNYAQGCEWKHSGGPYGENLAAGYANATLAVDAWGDEESKYNYGKETFTEDAGHFTQLVWSNTTSVGCGLVQCDSDTVKGAYLVCEYHPAGNVQGQFGYNVRKVGQAADGEPGLGAASGLDVSAKGTVAALVVAVNLLLAWVL